MPFFFSCKKFFERPAESAGKKIRDHKENLNSTFITSYERDNESDLDFAQARMFNYGFGRFSSPDPLMASAMIDLPQTWNRYSYVMNNPLNLIDPSGLIWLTTERGYEWIDDKDYYDSDGNVVDQYKDRTVAENGTVVYFGEAWGEYANGKYDHLRNGDVTLNDDGSLSPLDIFEVEDDEQEVSLALDGTAGLLAARALLQVAGGTLAVSAAPAVLTGVVGVGTIDLIANPRPGSMMNPLPQQRTRDGLPMVSTIGGPYIAQPIPGVPQLKPPERPERPEHPEKRRRICRAAHIDCITNPNRDYPLTDCDAAYSRCASGFPTMFPNRRWVP